MAVRIVLADVHGVTREGIRILLEEKPGLDVVGEAQDGVQMVRLAGRLKPDIIITDICMPELNGLDAAKQAIAVLPELRVIILSAYVDLQSVGMALLAGIRGYVLKHHGVEELFRAIDAVMAGQIYLCPKVTGILVGDYIRLLRQTGLSGLGSLSSKHRQVLQRIAEGRNTKQIALELGLTPKAIEAARRRIMKAIGVNSVAGLVKFALANRLTPL